MRQDAARVGARRHQIAAILAGWDFARKLRDHRGRQSSLFGVVYLELGIPGTRARPLAGLLQVDENIARFE